MAQKGYIRTPDTPKVILSSWVVSMAPGFRISAKNFSLTYPQCTISKENMFQYLQSMRPKYLLVSKELHEDGRPHLHAAISFDKRKNIKSPNFFDFEGFHANIQATKRPQEWIDYCKKDGVFLEEGTRPAAEAAIRRAPIDLNSVESSELFNFCLNNRVPYGYYCEEKKKRTIVDTTIQEDSSEGRMSWYLQCLQLPTSHKSIILTGSTGIGKTTWAIKNSPKPSLLVSHLDQLKRFNPAIHMSIIFDDMDFKHVPITAQIHLTDSEQPRPIHIRYGIVTLPRNIVKIFTCNEYPFSMHEAVARRVKHINANETIISIE